MNAAERLNQVGLRVTRPRLKVLQIFHSHKRRHLTADDVYLRVAAQNSGVGLATVYRVLSDLTDVGILLRSTFEAAKAVYEVRDGVRHDHLICLACGRVDEFTDPVIDERQKAIARASGYEVTQHQLALYGHCSGCRKRDKGKKKARKSP